MGTNEQTDARVTRAARGMLALVPPSILGRAALSAVVGAIAAGVAAYLYHETLGDFFSAAREDVVSNLGLGVAPAGLWLAAFVWTVAFRRAWLRKVGPWAGSVAVVAITLGILAYFQPYRGALAGFTLDGDVSLGGSVGQAILGPSTWLGALRLLGILMLGAAATAPPLAADAAVAMGKLLAYAYVLLVVVARAAGGRRRRLDPTWPTRARPAAVDEVDPDMPPEVLSPYTRVRTVRVDRAGIGGSLDASTSKVSGVEYPAQAGPTGIWVEDLAADTLRPAVDDEALGPVANDDTLWPAVEDEEPDGLETGAAQDETAKAVDPVVGKFNRFWDDSAAPSDDATAHGQNVYEEARAVPATPREARGWERPSTDLLMEGPEGGIIAEELQSTAETIRKTLADYGIEVEMGQIKPGPTVTMYGLVPGWVRRYKQVKETDEAGRPRLDAAGKPMVIRVENKTRVKVDSILAREKDLALALKTPSIRIETPVMGQALLGIEVPNPDSSLVTLRSVMESREFARLRSRAQLPVAIGKGSGGETVVVDLAKMPHLLIAGATGSGKSACLNAIISCLIVENSPTELRLLLIDPKRVELTPYNGIPHLLTPVVVETDRVVGYLKGVIHEMRDRYRRLEEAGVRNIQTYNERMPEKMPFLVVAIDELADLMMSAAFDVEQSLCRLAQLGRATGIHLIVATQRPSVDVVTGLIKANFPSRISFGVTSQVDSRTILDTAGADKLLGRGDMLYLPLDASRPERVQGVFISDREIESLVRFWQSTPWCPVPGIHLRSADADRSDKGSEDEDSGAASRDELLEKAIELGQSYSKLSTSLLQRRLRIGYPRAARLMDQLEEQGFVGPSDGSKSRDVIMGDT